MKLAPTTPEVPVATGCRSPSTNHVYLQKCEVGVEGVVPRSPDFQVLYHRSSTWGFVTRRLYHEINIKSD